MKQLSPFEILIIFISGLCSFLGLLVLIGWYTHSVQLIQVSPIFVPMQYNTALGFLLTGIGLFAVFKNKNIIGLIIFSIVGILGLLTILEYLLGFNVGIDELLMQHYITLQSPYPGRMAPNTAVCFLLTSISIILSITKDIRKVQISGVIGSVIFGLGLAALVRYLMHVDVTFGWGKLTNMALRPAIGFMMIGAGITIFSSYQSLGQLHIKKPNNDIWLSGYLFSLGLIIFFIDLSIPLGISTGTLYVPIILLTWFIKRPFISYIFAFFTILLCILGFFYSSLGTGHLAVILNRSFSIMALWIVAHLLFIIKKKNYKLIMINENLDQNLVELKNKNKELTQFTYIASHDLQEPLRTVANFTNLFEENYKGKLDEQASTYLRFISQASNRMSNLVKGLLDYSRIGYSRTMVTVNLKKILIDLQIDLFTTINETGTKLIIGPLPRVKGYKVELGLLFQNLILNAIKFRKEGEVLKISISAKDEVDFYKFSIKDNGIGIAKEHQKKIFSIFQRLHTQNEYEGTGIGLAHCQKIVELHQGTIGVDSSLGEGSTFTFTIKKK